MVEGFLVLDGKLFWAKLCFFSANFLSIKASKLEGFWAMLFEAIFKD